MAKQVPSYTGTLRNHSLTIPACVSECSGIRIFGRRIKSLAFSTDVAIIKNINADAIIAVYPFTPQPVISQAIISVSDVPVFVGVGGGITTGSRSVRLAIQSEHQGAYGVVLNAPTSDDVIRQIKKVVDIPVVITVVSAHTDIGSRRDFPEVPIIATGGPTEESILRTIQAGANAITYTPPSNGVLFARIMNQHRKAL